MMNKVRAFGYCLGWTKNKVHTLRTLALSNSSHGFHSSAAIRHHNLEHNASPSSLSRVTCSNKLLLGRVVKIRNYSGATSLYKNMCIKGIPVSSSTLNILINCLCLEGNVDYGLSLLGAFFKRGIAPDATTFNTLLRGLFRENRIPDATDLGWRVFEGNRDGELCKPNAVMMWILSTGYICDCNYEECVPCHSYLVWLISDLLTDPSCYWFAKRDCALFSALKIDEVLRIKGKMIEDGIAPNLTTYNHLFKSYGSLGNWKEVERSWTEMLSFEIEPDLVTYSILIELFTKHGLMEDPETMIHRGETMTQACTITYDRLIDICNVEGQENEARRIFDTVVANGFVPGIATSNFILEGLLQSGRCDTAKDFFSELQLGALKPNFDTYSIMLDGLCKNGLDNEALQLLEKMEKEGVELPMTMYSMILDDLRKNESFSCVSPKRKGFEEYKYDAQTYRKVITGLCEHGFLEEAKVLLGQNECSSYIDATVNVYVQGLLEGGKYDDVVAYLDKMVGREFGLNSSTMSHVLEFISKKENGLVPSHKIVRSQNVKATKTSSTCEEAMKQVRMELITCAHGRGLLLPSSCNV